MSRRDRRDNDPAVQAKREEFAKGAGAGPLGDLPAIAKPGSGADGGGWGVGSDNAKPATGHQPAVNPFIIPKAAGLNVISQTYPSNYFVEWNLTTWRYACDQVIKMGQTMSYAVLTSWTFQASGFVQSLFTKLGAAIDKVQFFVTDSKGNRLDNLTLELCMKPWQIQLRREILFSYFWGFCGLNFDPVENKIYKYPMQEIDPINRLLKQSTYSYYDGVPFSDTDNLLFVQPSTSEESFLGWMQAITRAFIQMNQAKTNWLQAGRRLAFPIMTVGYPQNDGGVDSMGNAINPYKIQAEDIVANADPSKGIVYPYTKDAAGNIQKAIEMEFESPKTAANTHKIFQEFNEDEKNEIRELILGGTLSSSTGSNGNRALGEVHERMFEAVVESKIDFVLATLNTDFNRKISKFYKGLPEGWRYEINRAKQLSVEEMQGISTVLNENGYRLTTDFFEANGLSKEFFEDAPTPLPPIAGKAPIVDEDPDVNMARPAKKKFW